MAKKRLIPKLQLHESSRLKNQLVLVCSKNFDSYKEIGDPVSQAKIYESQGADELIFINISKNHISLQKLAGVIFQVSKEIFMPLTVGGGIKTLDDVSLLLSNGADKVSINSLALENPDFISLVSSRYGAQCVVISIDYKRCPDGTIKVFKDGGQTKTNYDPLSWAKKAESMGAGEILLTCIDQDGLGIGLELNICAEIIKSINIPVIISGGCGLASHFIDGFKYANADAVAAGTFFAQRNQSFIETIAQIKNAGVEVRLNR